MDPLSIGSPVIVAVKLESAIDQAITEANAEPLNPKPGILKPDTLPIRKKVKPDANLSSID